MTTEPPLQSIIHTLMTKALSPWTAAHLPELAAVLLAAVIGTMVWLSLEYREEVAAVQRSLEVEKNLSRLLSTVQDAETGNRGFLLTGEDAYLQVYDRAVARIAGEFDTVQTLLADNPEQ